MNKTLIASLTIGMLLGPLASPVSAADEYAKVEALLHKAMKGAIRTEADVKRDANRLPIETLRFFGLRSDMKVLELLPGNGWYTKLLGPVLEDDGDLYVSLGTKNFSENLAGKPGIGFVTVLDPGSDIHQPKGSKFFTMNAFDFGPRDFDMVLTFRNYHNFDRAGRMRINEAVFRALKPGGVYGVIDHTRRHMEPDSPENRRRIDPVMAIKEIQDAGFELVDYSTLHYRPVDDLTLEVGNKAVTGRTDRFSLKFRKPE